MEAQIIAIGQPAHSAHEKLIEILNLLESEEFSGRTLSEVEEYLEADGQELLNLLLQEHLDKPEAEERVEEPIHESDEVVRIHKRKWEIGDQRLFGRNRVEQTEHSQCGVTNVFPLDAQLNLAANCYSYRLQKRVACKVIKDSFEGVVKDIGSETGVKIGQRQQIEEITYSVVQDFDAFYAQDAPEAILCQAQPKPLQTLTFDGGKGVVTRKEDLREETRKRAEIDATMKSPKGLSRKEKSNRKRMMATVVADIYHVDRHTRRPKTVAYHFAPVRLVARKKKPPPKLIAKKLWTSLEEP